MTKTTLLSIATLLAASSAALAQDKKAPAMAMKPAAELQQYKQMIGTWNCTGKMAMGGKTIKTTGVYKAAWALDGYWLVANFEGKAEGMPGAHKGVDYYGYDAGTKMYTTTGFDNMGNWSTMKSKGWEGDKQEWTGRGTMMGKETDMKLTVTKKGDKEITLLGTNGSDTYEASCKR